MTNIVFGSINLFMLALNLMVGDQGTGWHTPAIIAASFGSGWCYAFGIASIVERRYG